MERLINFLCGCTLAGFFIVGVETTADFVHMCTLLGFLIIIIIKVRDKRLPGWIHDTVFIGNTANMIILINWYSKSYYDKTAIIIFLIVNLILIFTHLQLWSLKSKKNRN